MMARVTVCLEEYEQAVLEQMSDLDCRPPRDQIRFLLREEASRRGLFDNGLKKLAVQGDTQMSTKNSQTQDTKQVLV